MFHKMVAQMNKSYRKTHFNNHLLIYESSFQIQANLAYHPNLHKSEKNAIFIG